VLDINILTLLVIVSAMFYNIRTSNIIYRTLWYSFAQGVYLLNAYKLKFELNYYLSIFNPHRGG